MKLERSIGNLAKRTDRLYPEFSSENRTGLSHWKGKSIILFDKWIELSNTPHYWTHHEEEIERHHKWHHNKGGKGVYSKTNKEGKINARKIVIDHYSNGKNCCACCNEKIYEFLTIDHLNGGGTKHRLIMDVYINNK